MWQASTVDEELIVFFDGDCLLCEGAVKWLNRMDDNDRLKFAPLQEGEAWSVWNVSCLVVFV